MQTKCYRMKNFWFCRKCYQDLASYKRWISRRDLISQNIKNQKREGQRLLQS